MHLPRFWAKETRSARDPSGKAYALAVWGWSDQDSAGARQMAIQRLAALARIIELGNQLNWYGHGYGGLERPLREPLIQAVPGADALISRNAYGALVLNTAHIFFADIDLPESPSGGLLGALFGRKPADPAEAALVRLHEWQARRPDWALRIYRTKAGLRVLATQEQFDPVSSDTQQLLASLGSDPLYTTLCRTQACFRARLTPKPWRIGLRAPNWRYPFETTAHEARFQAWLQRYEAAAPRFAVCRLLAELGSRNPIAEASAVLAIHDRYACPPGNLPLA
jgi:hypothetical protein